MSDKTASYTAEQISQIEHTLREVEQQGHRCIMLAQTLKAQLDELKYGPPSPEEPITDWSFVRNW
ncbi:MAG: hypothetical protein K9J79_03685 [Desulfobacteraceae bacterium]|nr:hypothetical protein [Desulfobacteraceae bacterium]